MQKRRGLCVAIGIFLLFSNTFCGVKVYAAEEYPLLQDISGTEGTFLELMDADRKEYTVLPGDSLWKIAGSLWGDGRYYARLLEACDEEIKNPDLIYPGMVFDVAQKQYVERNAGSTQMGEYAMGSLYGHTVGIWELGNAWGNFTLSDSASSASVACLVRDKEKETVSTVEDWERCTVRITEYAREHYPDNVSDLEFMHYLMEDQSGCSGEVYLYTYDWQLAPEYTDMSCKVCVGLKLTEHIQAQFIGWGFEEDILGRVRYVTASFEECYDETDGDAFTVNDSNMTISPESQWELAGLYDSFAFMDAGFGAVMEQIIEEMEQPETDEVGKPNKKYKEILKII